MCEARVAFPILRHSLHIILCEARFTFGEQLRPGLFLRRVRFCTLCLFQELEEHVKNLEKRFGAYNFAKPKTQYNPKRVQAQLLMTIPGYGGRDAETKPASGKNKLVL